MHEAVHEGGDEGRAVAALRRLVRRLPEARAPGARLLETHISLLLLSGDEAWKFKKPVRLPFADFSDAAERERLCHAEVMLNRRLAPSLYRGVVRVTGSEQRPRLGGRGRALAHAVHMHRFAARDEAHAALADGRLDGRVMRAFGARLAAFHANAEPLPAGSRLSRPADLDRAWRDDLQALQPLARGRRGERLRELSEAWTQIQAAARPTLALRRRGGRVRACHGDLHLGNLVLLDGELTAFDCIEFSDEFRFVDVMNELAFLFMDLQRHRRPRLAAALLEGYLEASGDYAGLAVLRLFAAYRASVRAKIAALRLRQSPPVAERRALRAEVDAHVSLAARLLAPPPVARLLLMHGVSGSGKSWLARRIADAGGYLVLRSDVARRRLFDVETAAGRRRAYAPAGVRATYRAMRAQARHALTAGLGVIADATFGDQAERRGFLALARKLGVAAAIVSLHAPDAVLQARVAARAAAGTDASQANLEVLRRQLAGARPLSAAERRLTLRVDSRRELRVDRVASAAARLAQVPSDGL